ncbi:ribonuclease H1 isoform X1 [Pygocentrus nattereri]|uniref:Ribonuclease H1 n=2 Tax=Pygocentrus nattereri TaxID=42514 RepID=A0AAR2LPK3_PYGNA|nr:ribonuclease H1 isoform X1 [Pygocentrus nattereri]XP_017537911.1 ribonuclease H1 isoform X1 [Pygocentrus nattereri]
MLRLPTLCSIVRRALCVSAEEMGKKGSFFYAVRKGHNPGVYQTWDECKHQVDKFPCAQYKKFASEVDAWAFVRNEATGLLLTTDSDVQLPKSVPVGAKRPCEDNKDDETNMKRFKVSEEPTQPKASSAAGSTDGFTHMGDAVVVYTDGCCSGNGRNGARAGIGVYWGPDHPLNVAERLPGRQTNQRAELQAACKALEQARDMNIKKLVLYTDSKFTINGITSWVKNWKINGWRLRTGGEVVNKEDFQKLDKLNGELEVIWMHIAGHAGYKGNEEADRLSREGAAKPEC